MLKTYHEGLVRGVGERRAPDVVVILDCVALRALDVVHDVGSATAPIVTRRHPTADTLRPWTAVKHDPYPRPNRQHVSSRVTVDRMKRYGSVVCKCSQITSDGSGALRTCSRRPMNLHKYEQGAVGIGRRGREAGREAGRQGGREAGQGGRAGRQAMHLTTGCLAASCGI